MKAGGGAKRNASLEQGVQVPPQQSRERQPPPGTVTLRNSVELEILTNLYTHLDQQRGREEGGANCHTKARFVARKNCTTFESEHVSSEAWQNPYAN